MPTSSFGRGAAHRDQTVEMLDQMRISSEREFDLTLFDGHGSEVDADGQPIGASHSQPVMFTDRRMEALGDRLVLASPPARPLDPERAFRKLGLSDPAMRAIDVTVAAAMILVFLPVMAAIWLALRLFERGPAIFAHERIGRGLATFPCFKFRTMCIDADTRLEDLLAADETLLREWNATQKLISDPRVTQLGRFLRNTSLDELPQLFNVLRGEMSLVGPRPIVANELRRYGRHASDYASVRPGLTGLWQVTRIDTTSYRRRVATDVFYIRHRGIGFACRILLATIPTVLRGNG